MQEHRAPSAADEGRAAGWRALLRRRWLAPLVVLLGGILLHSMNVLLLATVLPSIVGELGGAALMSWPVTAFLASSIVAATCTGLLSSRIGPRQTYLAGALVFCAGALLCALAPSMYQVIVGRFVQGFGGGLLSAAAYVLVRSAFPEALWPRVFALLAGVWSVSVLLGPLIGGVFASHDAWRGAFLAVAALAGLLAVLTLRALPRAPAPRDARPRIPGLRVGLVCAAIAALSLAAVVERSSLEAGLVVLTTAAFLVALRLDRTAPAPLLPRDAFSLGSVTGVGLWIALLLSVAFSPLQLLVPLFLQTLHGLDPLAAGYTLASASLAWTVAAVGVAGLSGFWPARLIRIGPWLMAAGLLGVAWLMPGGPVAALVPAIMLVGTGIGVCWAFLAQLVMRNAAPGEEDVAASAVATVQQTGLAIGAAAAGLAANAAGMSLGPGLDEEGVARAALWVPASFVCAALAAGMMGMRLRMLSIAGPRSTGRRG